MTLISIQFDQNTFQTENQILAIEREIEIVNCITRLARLARFQCFIQAIYKGKFPKITTGILVYCITGLYTFLT